MNKTTRITLITIVTFGIYYFFDDIWFRPIRKSLNEVINQLGVSHILAYFIVGVPIFAGALLIGGRKMFFSNLGLNGSIVKAFIFSAICTLPMFLGFALVFDFNAEFNLNHLLISVVAAGFFEELYFRGFLFGQLFKHTSFGFIPSIFLGALIFGLAHLYQSTDVNELIGIFLVTFLGAGLFAWVYVEWNFNIWVPVFLHALMDLSWDLFNVSENALGGSYANIYRATTVALVIVLTILYKRRKGLPIEINRRSIFMKDMTRLHV